MKHPLRVEKYMTPMPHTIGKDIPVRTALEMMRQGHIRHLPVQHGGKLVGVLSDRDIKLAASFDGAGEVTVEEAMTPDPYTVAPETPLEIVVAEMAEHKYGCAVVAHGGGRVTGIFTATDGLRVLAQLLHSRK